MVYADRQVLAVELGLRLPPRRYRVQRVVQAHVQLSHMNLNAQCNEALHVGCYTVHVWQSINVDVRLKPNAVQRNMVRGCVLVVLVHAL